MQKKPRPLGVSIIANLCIILGIIGLASIAAISVSGVNSLNAAGGRAYTAAGGGALGLEESLYLLVVGYGLKKGKGWAWTMSIIGIFDRICHYELRTVLHHTTNHRCDKQSSWIYYKCQFNNRYNCHKYNCIC
jgi:hypothetical protein